MLPHGDIFAMHNLFVDRIIKKLVSTVFEMLE